LSGLFAQEADYDKIECGDELAIDSLLEAIKGSDTVRIVKADGSFEFVGKLELSDRDREILLAAGLLNYTRKKTNE
jgi:aconitate hydratase